MAIYDPRDDDLQEMEAPAAHTPGPWLLSSSGVHVRKTARGFNICDLNDALPPGEWEANARLIAAAPELLAALRALVPDAEAWMKASGHTYQTSPLLAARAVIAKATRA